MPIKTLTTFACLSALIIAAAFLVPEKQYEFKNLNNYELSTAAESLNKSTDSKQNVSEENFSFLLLGKVGTGQGGQWHNASNLADVIMIVDYQSDEKIIHLVSLPRDLYGEFGNISFKINELIWRNEINEVLKKLPEISDAETDKYAIIDLAIVRKFIDGIGGIKINLPSKIVDSISGYSLNAGKHHLNGEDSIWILRNRYSREGDFFREKNQHLIIEAILNRYRTLNSVEKMKLSLSLGKDIEKIKTNIGFSQLLSLNSNINEIKIKGTTLDFSTGLLISSSTPVGNSSAYILIPKAGINNYEEIKKFINSQIQSN